MNTKSGSKSTSTAWTELSAASRMLVQVFASSPVWALTNFQKPQADLTDELIGAAWDRAGFCEQELRANPEVVVGALKKLVAEHLHAN